MSERTELFLFTPFTPLRKEVYPVTQGNQQNQHHPRRLLVLRSMLDHMDNHEYSKHQKANTNNGHAAGEKKRQTAQAHGKQRSKRGNITRIIVRVVSLS